MIVGGVCVLSCCFCDMMSSALHAVVWPPLQRHVCIMLGLR